MTVSAFAPAKINLTLHVTGNRADGFHLLDSLVVFADVGDQLEVAHADQLDLRIDGVFAADLPAGPTNLVLRAARLLGGGKGAAIRLTKNLPVASGIGGGSADAAATLRGLAKLWNVTLPGPDKVAVLGADVPVCLLGKSARMSGIGERLQPLPGVPELDIILVNPRTHVSTGTVFAALDGTFGVPMPQDLPGFSDTAGFADWLAGQRNDLQSPAISANPVIGDVLSAISASANCLLARMSGSGATCFGIYQTAEDAQAAAETLTRDHPNWWVRAAKTGVEIS